MLNNIEKLIRFGDFLSNHGENRISKIKDKAKAKNPWFTIESIDFALDSWASSLIEKEIKNWLSQYNKTANAKVVGLIPAGNIPLVGLHDLLSILVSGNKTKIKLSSKDEELMKACISFLDKEYPGQIEIVESLKNIEAIIATGSDTSFKYFEHYFGHLPAVFRKNRNSVAVVNGTESKEELHALGKDIFTYFGLGCRNVTHLIVPKDYVFNGFYEAILPYGEIIHHNKYNNNYSYNRAMYLMNKVPFLDNNFLMIQESKTLYSSIGVLNYHFSENEAQTKEYIKNLEDKIQCVVGHGYIPFGDSQKPKLNDYADNIDTLEFLNFK